MVAVPSYYRPKAPHLNNNLAQVGQESPVLWALCHFWGACTLGAKGAHGAWCQGRAVLGAKGEQCLVLKAHVALDAKGARGA